MREHGISWPVMLNLPLSLSLISDSMLNVVTRCYIGKVCYFLYGHMYHVVFK